VKLRLSYEFNLPDDLADGLIERLNAAGANMTASQITYARTDPKGHELQTEDWAKVRMALDEWATEGSLDPRLEQLRQLVGMGPS
jgi:hypothetical protein